MAVINPDEISSILKENIRNYEAKAEVSNVGSVLEVGDGICRIYGLRNVMSNELVEFEDGKGTLGMSLNLEEDNVGVVILGEYTHIKEGMSVKTTGRIASVPVGDALIGRIVNPTGRPIDGKGEIIWTSKGENCKYVALFNTDDKAREILVATLHDNIDAIAEWLVTDSPEIKISSTFNEPVGFVFDENENPITTNTVFAFLRKSKSSYRRTIRSCRNFS